MPLLPYVRRELFLQAIKNRDASALPDPNNREELFLKAIADEVALIPSGIPVALPAAVSEMLANLPEAHTHTERFYRDIIDAILVATIVTDTTPYLIRDTANHAPITPPARLTKKLGNTVAVNQLVDTAATSVTIPSGHKYYAVINGTASIGTSDGTAIAVTGGQDIVIDLTLWFGSNDRIPSDLLSHPENWGRYYAGSLDYNAGTLESADGTVLTSIGRNVWDEEWESGSLSSSTGQPDSSSPTAWRTKNYIPIIPNSSYYITASVSSKNCKARFYDAAKNYIGYKDKDDYNVYTTTPFTTPDNACFMKLSPSVADVPEPNHDITISLYYSGESGYDQYYPFSVLAEVDTGSEPLYGDGTEENSDIKLPSGEITRKRDRVDMGTLTYQLNTGLTGVDRFRVINYAPIKSCSASNTPSLKCVKFVASDMVTANAQFAVWAVGQDGKDIYFYTPAGSYAGSDAFKTAMSGIMLDFPLATPTTEQGTAFAENIPCDDFGSMYWTQTKGIPQGNEIFYPVDYKASFDTLYNIVDGDMSALATDDELQVVADRVPDAPSTDGTYSLKVSVSGGTKTYSWVADE